MERHRPPRGVNACIEALEKRRAWVSRRQGGTYDLRESIALGYALGLLRSAQRLELVELLEKDALEQGQIHSEWID